MSPPRTILTKISIVLIGFGYYETLRGKTL